MRANKVQTNWIMLRTILTTLYNSLAAIFASYFVPAPRRRAAMDTILHRWSKKLLSYSQITYQVFDPYKVIFEPGKHYIIMSNHASHYDIPLVFMAFPPSVRMLTKKELFQVPIWGHAMRAVEAVSIDRNNRQQAFRDLEIAKEKMHSGIILWIAPEGTRTRTGQLQPFKKGGFMLALQTGATIIPVGIRGTYDILPPKTWNLQLGLHAEVHIGKPIDATQYKENERDRLMEDVAISIRKELGNQ